MAPANVSPRPAARRAAPGGRPSGPLGQDLPGGPPDLQLLARLGEGRNGATWSARTAAGIPVAAKRLAAPPSAAVLSRLGSPGLSGERLVPVLGTWAEPAGCWVAAELAAGVSLGTLLRVGRLTPACAVTITMDVLDSLSALHQAELWHGSLHPGNVHVGPAGSVRLGDFGLAVRGDLNDEALKSADIRAAGALLCTMLGIPSEPGARGAARAPKLMETPLGAHARVMARSTRKKRAAGYEAIQARLALWEAAGRLATRRSQGHARERLAEMVAACSPAPAADLLQPAPAPDPAPPAAIPPRPAPAVRRVTRPRPRLGSAAASGGVLAVPDPAEPPRPRSRPPAAAAARERGLGTRALLALAAVMTVSAVLTVVAVPRSSALHRQPPAGPYLAAHAFEPGRSEAREEGAAAALPAVPATGPPNAPEVRPRPGPVPVLAGPAAGPVTGVQGRPASDCGPGAACLLAVEIWFGPQAAARTISWQIMAADLCSGSLLALGAGSVLAWPGWTHVAADSTVSLPGAAHQALIVLSDAPDRAASPPIRFGDPAGRC